ncbi:MAG: helix-turn-helix domain-containing protein [Holosporaceae bacterium]|jgi:DNA-binding XRE family transcriptional regulator|nr:helix-turn-helix domain-containing protein [Holosporaceae bacterium]
MEINHCCYCGRELVFPVIETAEHIIPRSRGGNSHKNLQPCCYWCNTWRSRADLRNWRMEIQEILNEEHRTKPPYTRNQLEIIIKKIDFWINYINEHRSEMIVEKDPRPKKKINPQIIQRKKDIIKQRVEFCKNIEKIRKESGYTNNYLAEKIGTDPFNLSRLENGSYSPKLDTLIALLNELNIQIEFVKKQ